MAEIEGKDKERPEWVKRWKPGEPLPWAKFDCARWLADPSIRLLTPEQRGRFMDVWAVTHRTKTPGDMTEEQVRAWAGYTPAEWKLNREAFEQVFNTTRKRGRWLLPDVIETWKASMKVAKRNHERARRAADSRSRNVAERNGMKSTSSAPSTRQAVLGAEQKLETQPSGLREIERSPVPDSDARSAQPGSAGHSPVASGGTVAVSDLLGRALRAGCADGPDGTARASGGGA